MTDYHWVRVTSCSSIPAREGRAVTLGTRDIAVFNLGDRFLATANACPHKGGPLCDGIVSGTSVVCPLHGWKVDLDTGCVERPTGATAHGIETYPTRIEDGVVVIGIPRASPLAQATANAPADGAAA